MRISEAWVEFEHHGSLPIAQEAQSYHHWEQLVFEVPLAAVLVGFEEVVATVQNGEIIRFDVYDPSTFAQCVWRLVGKISPGLNTQNCVLPPHIKIYVEETGTGRGFVAEAGEEITAFAQGGKLFFKDGAKTLWEFDRRLYLWADQEGMIQIKSFQRGTTAKFYPPRYRGRFELTAAGGRTLFLAINEVDLEEYLYQVVPSEMVISWPLEALKAQAVASRTYAVAQVIYSRRGGILVFMSVTAPVLKFTIISLRRIARPGLF